VEPWALPPVVGADGSAVVLVRGDGREGLAWIERDGALATIYELPASLALSHGMPAAPGGPAKLPVMVGDRAMLFIAVKRPAATVVDGLPPVDAPAIVAPILATLVGTSGGSQDGVLALERTGPVAGWPILLPPRTYAGEALLAPDGSLIVAGTTEGEGDPLPGIVAAVNPAATGAAR
jgi:hypothetical protein